MRVFLFETRSREGEEETKKSKKKKKEVFEKEKTRSEAPHFDTHAQTHLHTHEVIERDLPTLARAVVIIASFFLLRTYIYIYKK